MLKKSFVYCVFCGLLAGSGITSAADENAVVLEDMTRAQLREEIEKYENEFYRVFNANVTDDRFEIHCTRYTPTNSNISVRACEPNFVVDARNENATNFQLGIGVQLSPADIRKNLEAEFAELTKMLNAVLAENDYFRALNTDLTMLRQMLAEKESN